MESILFRRRSIRKYKPTPIKNEDVDYILKTAMYAPSAHNEQPWHFIVIDDRTKLNKIADFHPYAKMLYEAPLCILVCADLTLQKSPDLWIQDCSAATENILLAATERGLGSVWIALFPRKSRIEFVRQLLEIPENIIPFSFVAIGYPDEEKPFPQDRYKPERIHKNTF